MKSTIIFSIFCISFTGIFSLNNSYSEENEFHGFWFEQIIKWESDELIPKQQFISSLHWMQTHDLLSKNEIKNLYYIYLNQQSEKKITLESCISNEVKTITVTCPYARLTDINEVINDKNILREESKGVWLLNSNLTIRDDSTFFIDSSDTEWLKLNSDKNSVSNLKTYGNLLIDSVKITSWNSHTNDYAITDGETPRSSIQAAFRGTGVLDVTNSEIAYLGYHKGGLNGMAFMKGGHNSLVKGNEIHHMWYGLYSNGVGGITVENNFFHNNNLYSIDPHTATHDMIIRNNTVKNTNGNGIICSLDCYNITIENNKLYNNSIGIVLHRNTTDSIVRNNFIYNSSIGIDVNESTRNEVYNNKIHNSRFGITIKFNEPRIIPDIGKGFTANENIVHNNLINNSSIAGILVQDGASDNTIQDNIIRNSKENAIHVKDSNSVNNLFLENKIIEANNALNIENNTSSTFIKNTINDDTIFTDIQIDKSCITIEDRTITVTCPYARLTEVNEVINDKNILREESDGVWLLNANLIIRDDSTFFIDSSDTEWLKLNSHKNYASNLKTYGNLLIDSVKITSWNSTVNDYAITDGETPRSSIQAAKGGSGVMNVTNSEIAYLGYHKGGLNGMAYMGSGHNSLVKGNDVHHMWYGFYTHGVGGIIVENNLYHDNNLYGIDPHTSTHDMIIRNNIVRNTNEIGIVCSHDCYNIIIENNIVHDNRLSIFFSRNMTDSIVRNNTLFNSDVGIRIGPALNNQIYNNTIYDNRIGIVSAMSANPVDVGKGYTIKNNTIYNNKILNSKEDGILLMDGASDNIIEKNIIKNSIDNAIRIKDIDTKNNKFFKNMIINAKDAVQITNNTSTLFVENTIQESKNQFLLSQKSHLFLENTAFSNDIIESDGDDNTVTILKSGVIKINEDGVNEEVVYDTNDIEFFKVLKDGIILLINTL